MPPRLGVLRAFALIGADAVEGQLATARAAADADDTRAAGAAVEALIGQLNGARGPAAAVVYRGSVPDRAANPARRSFPPAAL